MTTENYNDPNRANIPWHRRRRSIYAVLLVIAIVVIVVVGISLGPTIPVHPVEPGQEASPPPDNTTSPSPTTTSVKQESIDYSIAIYNLPKQPAMIDVF
ncbi:MAG: hypothetical protein ACFCUE_00580 [Candidatus Bathyarchaeia archaeon]